MNAYPITCEGKTLDVQRNINIARTKAQQIANEQGKPVELRAKHVAGFMDEVFMPVQATPANDKQNVLLAMRSAFEYGFHCAEKGQNLEMALSNFDERMQ